MTFADHEQLVRTSYDAWSRGDFDTLFAIYDRDCEWDNTHLRLPDSPQIVRGHAAMREFWRTSVGAFGGVLRTRPLEIAELPGERVAVTGIWEATTGDEDRASLAAAIPPFGQVIEFKAGRISRVTYFRDPAEAHRGANT